MAKDGKISDNETQSPAGKRPKLMTLANFFTAMRFGLTPVFVVLFISHGRIELYIAFVCAVVAMISDALDGYYARKHKNTSTFGKIFDPLADAFFFLALFITFAVMEIYPVWLALPFIFRELTQHLYVRPTAAKHGVVMGAKMIGKIKMGVQCFAGLLVVFFEIVRSYDEYLIRHFKTDELFVICDWTVWITMGITAFISVASIVPYLKHLNQVLSQAPKAKEAGALSQ